MRKFLITLLAAGTMSGLGAATAMALPATGPATHDLVTKTNPMVQNVRLYCYDRNTGRFLHWGPCWHDRWRYRHWHHRHWYYRHHHRYYR